MSREVLEVRARRLGAVFAAGTSDAELEALCCVLESESSATLEEVLGTAGMRLSQVPCYGVGWDGCGLVQCAGCALEALCRPVYVAALPDLLAERGLSPDSPEDAIAEAMESSLDSVRVALTAVRGAKKSRPKKSGVQLLVQDPATKQLHAMSPEAVLAKAKSMTGAAPKEETPLADAEENLVRSMVGQGYVPPEAEAPDATTEAPLPDKADAKGVKVTAVDGVTGKVSKEVRKGKAVHQKKVPGEGSSSGGDANSKTEARGMPKTTGSKAKGTKDLFPKAAGSAGRRARSAAKSATAAEEPAVTYSPRKKALAKPAKPKKALAKPAKPKKAPAKPAKPKKAPAKPAKPKKAPTKPAKALAKPTKDKAKRAPAKKYGTDLSPNEREKARSDWVSALPVGGVLKRELGGGKTLQVKVLTDGYQDLGTDKTYDTLYQVMAEYAGMREYPMKNAEGEVIGVRKMLAFSTARYFKDGLST